MRHLRFIALSVMLLLATIATPMAPAVVANVLPDDTCVGGIVICP